MEAGGINVQVSQGFCIDLQVTAVFGIVLFHNVGTNAPVASTLDGAPMIRLVDLVFRLKPAGVGVSSHVKVIHMARDIANHTTSISIVARLLNSFSSDPKARVTQHFARTKTLEGGINLFPQTTRRRGAAVEVFENAQQATIADLQSFMQFFDTSRPQAKAPDSPV